MGHVATGCKGHRGRERKRHTQRTGKAGGQRQMLIAWVPSCQQHHLWLSPPWVTHIGVEGSAGVRKCDACGCGWVCVRGAVNFPVEERNNKSCDCRSGFEPTWPNHVDYKCRETVKASLSNHFLLVTGGGHNLNPWISGFKWKKSLKSLNIDISVNQCLIDWCTQVVGGCQVCVAIQCSSCCNIHRDTSFLGDKKKVYSSSSSSRGWTVRTKAQGFDTRDRVLYVFKEAIQPQLGKDHGFN